METAATHSVVTQAADRLIGIKEVQPIAGLRKSAIYIYMKKGKFPKPVRLSARCTRWRLSEVNAWIQQQSEHAA